MPEGWLPGQPILVPDPNDPSGKKMIEVPFDQMEVVAEMPQAPSIGADIDVPDKLNLAPKGKKKKKKKKKKLDEGGNDLGTIENLLN
jgi:hypothetical protein